MSNEKINENLKKQIEKLEGEIKGIRNGLATVNKNINNYKQSITSLKAKASKEDHEESDYTEQKIKVFQKHLGMAEREKQEKLELIQRIQATLYNFRNKLKNVNNEDDTKHASDNKLDSSYTYVTARENYILREDATIKSEDSKFSSLLTNVKKGVAYTKDKVSSKTNALLKKIEDCNDKVLVKRNFIAKTKKDISELEQLYNEKGSIMSPVKKNQIQSKIKSFKEQIFEANSDINDLLEEKGKYETELKALQH